MTPVYLDVAFKDGNGELENVETLCAVQTEKRIYAFSIKTGWLAISTKRVGKDQFSGAIVRNGFEIVTRITTVRPGHDRNLKQVSDVDPEVEQMLMAAFA